MTERRSYQPGPSVDKPMAEQRSGLESSLAPPVPTENSIRPSDTCTYKNYVLILSTSIPNSDFVIILLFEDKALCGERYSGNDQGPEKKKER